MLLSIIPLYHNNYFIICVINIIFIIIFQRVNNPLIHIVIPHTIFHSYLSVWRKTINQSIPVFLIYFLLFPHFIQVCSTFYLISVKSSVNMVSRNFWHKISSVKSSVNVNIQVEIPFRNKMETSFVKSEYLSSFVIYLHPIRRNSTVVNTAINL